MIIYLYSYELHYLIQKVRAFTSDCAKKIVYFNIRTYIFFILHIHFLKHPTSDYLFYTTFHYNIKFFLILLIISLFSYITITDSLLLSSRYIKKE